MRGDSFPHGRSALRDLSRDRFCRDSHPLTLIGVFERHTRKPAQLMVLDSESGAMVASVPCVNDSDDVYYDASRKRIYAPGGEGFISVIQQSDADHYKALAKIPTTVGARTGLWYEKRDRFYLAVPASSKQGAALWVYAPED
jgi:hypothetical protein